jgi:DNA-binding MarR family transcriptional regulator
LLKHSVCDDLRVGTLVTDDYTADVGFLLRQLGFYSSTMFAEQLATIKLTAAQAGVLRAVAADPGRSQHYLSAYLGLAPGRLVAYLDELEERGYVERRRDSGDRRRNALHLTEAGKKLMRKIAGFARQHEHQLTAGLNNDQSSAFRDLLAAVAQHQGLTPHVHPGSQALDNWLAQPHR